LDLLERIDDPRVRADTAEKMARLCGWMERRGFGAPLISRRDYFAWLMVGGDSAVLKPTEMAVARCITTAFVEQEITVEVLLTGSDARMEHICRAGHLPKKTSPSCSSTRPYSPQRGQCGDPGMPDRMIRRSRLSG
jgi:hypothetical protein